VGAVGTGDAGNAAVSTCAALASESGKAVVGIIAAAAHAETAVDFLVAHVGGVSAVLVVLASAATADEATREVFASGGDTDLTGIAVYIRLAQGIRVGAGWTDSTSLAPGATTIGLASIHPAIKVATIDTAIRIGGGIAARIVGRHRGGRLATAGRDRSGQQEGSKESHCRGGRRNRHPWYRGA